MKYNVMVIVKEIINLNIDADGSLHRLWDGWSSTTGRHIFAFCGYRKKEWDKMEVER